MSKPKRLFLAVGELVTVRSVYNWATVTADLGTRIKVRSIYRTEQFGNKGRRVREEECRRAYPTFAGPYLPPRRFR